MWTNVIMFMQSLYENRLFFSVYVNDLVEHFNLVCDPVSINGKYLSCLLYADDIVLMSHTANGLQKLLDNLKFFVINGP